VNRPVDVPLVGDLRAVVPQLTEALADTPRAPSPELEGWIREDATRLAQLAESAPAGMSPVHPDRGTAERAAGLRGGRRLRLGP
jgi:acetolactate synthase I/II/III large subunit